MAVPAFACAPCACCPAAVFLSFMFFVIKAVIAPGFHLFPFRTEQLSPCAPMVLHTRGRVGRRRFSYITSFRPAVLDRTCGAVFFFAPWKGMPRNPAPPSCLPVFPSPRPSLSRTFLPRLFLPLRVPGTFASKGME